MIPGVFYDFIRHVEPHFVQSMQFAGLGFFFGNMRDNNRVFSNKAADFINVSVG